MCTQAMANLGNYLFTKVNKGVHSLCTETFLAVFFPTLHHKIECKAVKSSYRFSLYNNKETIVLDPSVIKK